MNYAIIENDIVTNVAVSDSPLEANWIQSDTAGIGYLHINGEFFAPTPPPVPTPQVVSRAQFILALLQIDLLDDVEAAIAAADRATQINYKERLEFERGFPLIATMAQVMGKTDAEIDGLFVLAATL